MPKTTTGSHLIKYIGLFFVIIFIYPVTFNGIFVFNLSLHSKSFQLSYIALFYVGFVLVFHWYIKSSLSITLQHFDVQSWNRKRNGDVDFS